MAPYFTSPVTTVSITDTTAIGTPIYPLLYTDDDPEDIPSLKTYMLSTSFYFSHNTLLCKYKEHASIQKGEGYNGSRHPGKSQVAIGFLRNTGTDPHQEAIGHFRSNFFSREVCTALCEIR